MRVLLAFFIIALTAGAGEAGSLRVNNIRVNEYDMIWSYNETYTGADSIAFRIDIDTGLGDNNSFVNAWEVLLADKELRKEFRNSIEKEQDVRINNETSRVYLVDVDAALSPDIIGKTHLYDTIVNRYITTYRFDNSILNAEISGFFKEISKDRGEITLTLSRNASFIKKEINGSNASNVASTAPEDETNPLFEMLSWIRNVTIVVAGLVIISLIYIFKIRKN